MPPSYWSNAVSSVVSRFGMTLLERDSESVQRRQRVALVVDRKAAFEKELAREVPVYLISLV